MTQYVPGNRAYANDEMGQVLQWLQGNLALKKEHGSQFSVSHLKEVILGPFLATDVVNPPVNCDKFSICVKPQQAFELTEVQLTQSFMMFIAIKAKIIMCRMKGKTALGHKPGWFDGALEPVIELTSQLIEGSRPEPYGSLDDMIQKIHNTSVVQFGCCSI
jgi:hypothetical protein